MRKYNLYQYLFSAKDFRMMQKRGEGGVFKKKKRKAKIKTYKWKKKKKKKKAKQKDAQQQSTSKGCFLSLKPSYDTN